MRRYVRRHISGCFVCLIGKVPGGKKPGELHPIPPPSRPFERVHMDHLGPFVKSKKGHMFLLVIVDALTKFVRLYPAKNTSTRPLLRSMERFITEHGLPRLIVTDRGTCFTSKAFREFCETRGIHHTLNSTRHPQANGQVESVNRTVVPVIMASMENEDRWDESLHYVERDLNNAESNTTHRTPFEALYGYLPNFQDGKLRATVEVDPAEWIPLDRLREELISNAKASQHQANRRYDKKRYLGLVFQVGDVVVMRRGPEMTGQPTKTQPRYRGPLVIEEVLPSDTYRVSQIREAAQGKVFSTTAHVSQLKVYRNAAEDMEDSDETTSSEEGDDQGESPTPVSDSEEEADQGREPSPVSQSDEGRPAEAVDHPPGRTRRRPTYLKDYVEPK